MREEILDKTKEMNNGLRGGTEDPDKGGMGDRLFAVNSFWGGGRVEPVECILFSQKKKKILLIRIGYTFNSFYSYKRVHTHPSFQHRRAQNEDALHASLPVDLPLLLGFNHCAFFISLLQHLEVVL